MDRDQQGWTAKQSSPHETYPGGTAGSGLLSRRRHRLRLSPTGAVTVVIRQLGLTKRAKDQAPSLTHHWHPRCHVEAMWHEDHCVLAFIFQFFCFS